MRGFSEFDQNARHHQKWLVTYTDLISLLLNFFVMIFTFSTIDSENFQKIRGALVGTRSTLKKTREHDRTALDTPKEVQSRNDEVSDEPRYERYERLRRELTEKAIGRQLTGIEIELTDDGNGLHIELSRSSSFLPGTAALRFALQSELERLAPLFADRKGHFEFVGHASRSFRPTRSFASVDELCLRRAENAATFFCEVFQSQAAGERLPWKRLVITSHAQNDPRAPGHGHGHGHGHDDRRVSIIVRLP